ncbi:MAG: heme-binding protein [Terrimesophilobacter sp.]
MSESDEVVNVPTITTALARKLVQYAIDQATVNGKPMVISIVDVSGVLKAFVRMDGAPLLSVGISQNKAYTAASFGLPTDGWFDFIKGDEPLKLGIVHTDRLVTYGGGYPIVVGGKVVGGIGLSGGHYSDDMAVAQAALKSAGLEG